MPLRRSRKKIPTKVKVKKTQLKKQTKQKSDGKGDDESSIEILRNIEVKGEREGTPMPGLPGPSVQTRQYLRQNPPKFQGLFNELLRDDANQSSRQGNSEKLPAENPPSPIQKFAFKNWCSTPIDGDRSLTSFSDSLSEIITPNNYPMRFPREQVSCESLAFPLFENRLAVIKPEKSAAENAAKVADQIPPISCGDHAALVKLKNPVALTKCNEQVVVPEQINNNFVRNTQVKIEPVPPGPEELDEISSPVIAKLPTKSCACPRNKQPWEYPVCPIVRLVHVKSIPANVLMKCKPSTKQPKTYPRCTLESNKP